MMSLKRYATLLAAVTPQNPPNATTRAVSTVMSITTIAPSSSSSVAPSSSSTSRNEESQSQSLEHGTSSSSSSFTTYYSSGLGLYHQRGVSGSAGSVGGQGGAAGAGGPQTYANVVNGNVNLLLGGAMLSLVTTILCVVCYCCHRNIKKRTEAAYRQQQHQWLETDPNMEIYSVEQCYETSGLFLGDSTDGLSVMPTLHHEPPPSYDAVVLHEQQLLQQQQQHQQQLEQLQLQQQQILMQRISPPPGYRSSLDIITHHHPHGPVGGCSRGTPDGSVDAMASGSGAIRGGGAAGAAAAAGCGAAVNKELQLALNAQSCCSLQRAEVESMWNATEMKSMWNAGAAAVAARRGNCLEMETLPPPPAVPLALQGRKHGGQQGFGLNTLGRRYLQQSHQHSHYRQGCPLCGKFRYEAEAEDEVSPCALSVESGLNMGSMRSREEPPEDANENRMLASAELATCPCPCSNNCDNENGNGNNMIGEAQPEDEANGNVQPATREAINETTTTTITDVNEENDNASVAATSSARNEEEQPAASQDLSNINENGFISLDMSKIIDRSGLPTYEGALKLESSGYV
ncbi:uncharacterized protein LOC117193368 isoform X2 [Drosophila miranda]|uniref:uncharacterized protein LOC117193368 isoform X2 n=1 Tax=Drosophila miranda TaxID=7229 RepID=UPI00143F7034|nr:uncharacterized protein LOC117193368 isoform X2 [Drosophila miranda]